MNVTIFITAINVNFDLSVTRQERCCNDYKLRTLCIHQLHETQIGSMVFASIQSIMLLVWTLRIP